MVSNWLGVFALREASNSCIPYRGYPISSLSKQPKNKSAFEIALFKKSLYGIPKDMKLLSWIQHAYDSQYFVTTAPRNTQRFMGRFYELSYKFIELIGLYHLLALLVNLLFNNRVKLDPKILYRKNLIKKPFAKLRMLILENELRKYRKRIYKTYWIMAKNEQFFINSMNLLKL